MTQFQLTLECALERGLSRARIVQEAAFHAELDDLCARDYVPWGDFARLLNAIERMDPDAPWADAIADKFLDLPVNRRLQSLFRHVSDPYHFYQGLNRFFGPYQYPCISSSLTRLDGRRIQIHHHIHPNEFVQSNLFLVASMRCMECFPRVFMGLPESSAELFDGGGARPRFVITLPHSRSLFGRVKQATGSLLGFSDSLDVLELQLVEMRERLKALDEEEAAKQAIIDERSVELERLEAALLEAQRESEAKSDYLASLSHELRTPLNAIIGGTELVIEEMQDDGLLTYEEDLERINHAGRQLLGLIEHVLDLSKIEAGRMVLSPERVAIEDFIDALIAPMELLARQRGVTLAHELSTSHDVIEADRLRLQQILTNLLGNALKFAPGASVCLRVRDASLPDRIIFEVEDRGIGIAPEALETLFAPFTQADATIQKRFGGTGLGLTIAREFALLMGGELGVESTLGEGTCFTLDLPITPGRSGNQ